MFNQGYNRLGSTGGAEDGTEFDRTLDSVEIRVIGALLEKERTTPEYYPLSLNALLNACNQKTSRHPVVAYDEETVLAALDSLRTKQYVHTVSGAEHRVTKYRQSFTRVLHLGDDQAAVLCVLMLRGTLTPGEIRSSSNRLHEFAGLDDVETTLDGLIRHDPPLVARLSRQAGQKELRYAHLLGGETMAESIPAPGADPAGADLPDAPAADRLTALEQEVAELRRHLAELQARFDEFHDQFE